MIPDETHPVCQVQLLHLTDLRWDALIDGKKIDTIRLDEGEIEPGFLAYESYPSKTRHAIVLVTTTYKKIALRDVLSVTLDKVHRSSEEILLKQMRRHYPKITLETPVDFIQHLTPQETLEHFSEEVKSILDSLEDNQ